MLTKKDYISLGFSQTSHLTNPVDLSLTRCRNYFEPVITYYKEMGYLDRSPLLNALIANDKQAIEFCLGNVYDIYYYNVILRNIPISSQLENWVMDSAVGAMLYADVAATGLKASDDAILFSDLSFIREALAGAAKVGQETVRQSINNMSLEKAAAIKSKARYSY